MNPKTILRWTQTGRRQTRHCDIEGCKKATREGKPFCSNHVKKHPYVQKLLAQVDHRKEEEERVRRLGPRVVDLDGLTAREILLTLWVNGDRTVARLSRELNMEFKVLLSYVRALKRANLVTLKPTRRGAGIVRLVTQVADPRQVAELTAQGGGQTAA